MRHLFISLLFAGTVVCAGGLVVAAVAVSQPPAVAQAQQFQFTDGFRTLADLIPNVVGQPVENPQPQPNGNVQQQTTTGLMVWRKALNSPAFTNGTTTWVLGPFGLQVRPDTDRFEWELRDDVTDTEVIVFSPTGVVGPAREGRCFSESLASTQANAWRCSSGNEILDPAFAEPGNTTSVIAGATPLGSGVGFTLNLTEPLSAPTHAVTEERPWIVELADGTACEFLTGATGGVGGERINYGCTDGSFIVGDVQTDTVWTARQVFLADGFATVVSSFRVFLRTVWF